MQKQSKPELLGVSIAKMILVVSFIVSFGALLGAVGYLIKNKQAMNGNKIASDCPAIVSDIDNNIYKTVKIGEQCWMKENLKVTKNPAGETIVRYCYDNDSNICNTDGGLYDWNTAMDGSIEEGSQGICPSGWHVPKDSEWHILEKYLAPNSCLPNRERKGVDESGPAEWGCNPAGTSLKVGGFSGFEGIFTGFRFNDNFWDRGTHGSANFWSSTKGWYRMINGFRPEVARSFIVQGWGISSLSVRCIKD